MDIVSFVKGKNSGEHSDHVNPFETDNFGKDGSDSDQSDIYVESDSCDKDSSDNEQSGSVISVGSDTCDKDISGLKSESFFDITKCQVMLRNIMMDVEGYIVNSVKRDIFHKDSSNNEHSDMANSVEERNAFDKDSSDNNQFDIVNSD